MKKLLTLLLLVTFLSTPFNAQGLYYPTDPYIEYQDYFGAIDFMASNPSGHPEGEGVVVAVIDSGVWQGHSDLVGKFWTNNKETPNNGIDDDNNGYVDDYYGYNFVDNNANLITYDSHGTAVSDIIAAKRDDNGILGIANKSKIMSLIACGGEDVGCTDNAVQKAIKYAADNGADIINLSLGYGNGYVGYKSSYDYYIKYAFDRDVIIVAAAGNGDIEGYSTGLDLNNFSVSPVCNDDSNNMIVGVGASDASWSNYGNRCVDIKAPGVDIFTGSVPTHDVYTWQELSGTSFSAPMVAAAAAIIKSKQPSLKNWEITERKAKALKRSKPCK